MAEAGTVSMRLSGVAIESFRGIGRLELPLDPLTVVIGENNHGKTSLLDLLQLCLGGPGAATRRFSESDFHRPVGAASRSRAIGVVLTFEPDPGGTILAPGEAALEPALTQDSDGRHRIHAAFSGRPSGLPEGTIEASFVDARGKALDPQPAPEVLAELRRLHPVLLVRFAQRGGRPAVSGAPEGAGDAADGRGLEAEIARVYRELASARGPVPTESLRRALDAAHELYRRIKARRPSSLGPLRRMLDDLLLAGDAPGPDARPGRLAQMGRGSQTLGLLLVLGAVLDVRGDETLAAESSPVIAIEEPEVHLHPILLASTWDVIESLDAQTLITTNSGEFLSAVPLRSLRRFARRDGRIVVHRLEPGTYTSEELRRIGYHVRAKRGGVLFARCWLMVEGESEFWLMRELARVLGYDLDAEGVRCVEFAQCGVGPLAKLANDLGIGWHVLADGDEAGMAYAADARGHLGGLSAKKHVTRLRQRDIERCLWYHGFDDVYREAARLPPKGKKKPDARYLRPGEIIRRGIRAHSKPYLAQMVAEACDLRGPDSVPGVLRHVIESTVQLARAAIDDGSRELLRE